MIIIAKLYPYTWVPNPHTSRLGGISGLFFHRIPYFCIGMKKALIIIAYWIVAILLTTVLLVSLDYDMAQAGIMSLTFLPSAMALSFFLPKVDRTKDRNGRIMDSIFIILGVMTLAFFLIFSIQWFFVFVQESDSPKEWTLPAMLGNPVFVSGILAVLAYGNYMLERWLSARFPLEKPISFFSGYRKVSLRKEDISYIESRDSEVWVVVRDGQTYRNRNGIGQWENLLGEGFLRIHRAFLVNISHATLSTPDTVLVDGKELPVSRKNKETVKAVLQQ